MLGSLTGAVAFQRVTRVLKWLTQLNSGLIVRVMAICEPDCKTYKLSSDESRS